MGIMSWLLSVLLVPVSFCSNLVNKAEEVKPKSGFVAKLGGLNSKSAVIYKEGENYVIEISKYDKYLGKVIIKGRAVFSPDKKLLYAKGITPVDRKDCEKFEVSPVKDFEKRYGKEHYNVGYSYSMPVYITKDSAIIGFDRAGGLLYRIGCDDIATIYEEEMKRHVTSGETSVR